MYKICKLDAEYTGKCDSRHVGRRMKDDEWWILFNKLNKNLGGGFRYNLIFNPLDCKEISVGNLADDLADIYRDLSNGLNLFNICETCGINNWVVDFRFHLGSHLLEATKVVFWMRCG